MTRLGPKVTVRAFLDQIERRQLLHDIYDDHKPTHVQNNWESILDELPRKWQPQQFLDRLSQFLGEYAWDYRASTKQSPIGEKVTAHFIAPSFVEVAHSDLNAKLKFVEPCASFQGWRISARKGKAKIEIIPSSVFVSVHALERIYERHGGCTLDEFPHLVTSLASSVDAFSIANICAGSFRKFPDKSTGLAVPLKNGLALAEWHNAIIGKMMPQFGINLRVLGSKIGFGPGENLLLAEDAEHEKKVLFADAPVCLIRTFYGLGELNEERKESYYLLSELAKQLPVSPLALQQRCQIDPPQIDATFATFDQEIEKIHQRTLWADARDSLSWVEPPRQEMLAILPSGGGKRLGV